MKPQSWEGCSNEVSDGEEMGRVPIWSFWDWGWLGCFKSLSVCCGGQWGLGCQGDVQKNTCPAWVQDLQNGFAWVRGGGVQKGPDGWAATHILIRY